MKRNALLSLFLLGVAMLAACAATGDESARNVETPAAPSSPASSAPSPAAPPISTAHGGALTPSAPRAAATATDAGATPATMPAPGKPEIDTAALDANIEKAEAKAKKARASEADKRAAAEAYFERGYKYYTAQKPSLYKFALGDFRRVLRYQPDHQEARDIIDQIESIYRSMGRPVPTNGLEP